VFTRTLPVSLCHSNDDLQVDANRGKDGTVATIGASCCRLEALQGGRGRVHAWPSPAPVVAWPCTIHCRWCPWQVMFGGFYESYRDNKWCVVVRVVAALRCVVVCRECVRTWLRRCQVQRPVPLRLPNGALDED
jgi:hypothetical protein